MSDTPLGEGYVRRDGIIYGPDGKPCRTCNSVKDLLKLGSDPSSSSSSSPFSFQKRPKIDPEPSNKEANKSTSEAVSSAEEARGASYDPSQCPPDVEALGRATWTFLHSAAANYPPRPTPVQQTDMASFIRTFSTIYPCWTCAEEFREWLAKRENQPVLDQGWAGLGQWMCRAHNEVNRKLGKEEFDCKLWRQRWKDGWKDGRCDP